MNYKTFVLGLDGATWDLLRPWADRGFLPTFQRLMRRGAWGELRSTVPPMTPAAWTSFATGKNPGKHRLCDWAYRRAGTYNVSPLTADHLCAQTLWSLLSWAGRRVCVINVPMTYPPQPVNGLLVSGMPAPSTKVPITYPEALLHEIERAVGEYLLYPDPGRAYSDTGVDAFLQRLYRTTERRLQVLAWARARETWDFLMLVLNGTDTVQHAMWKYMSPTHPLHDPSKAARYGSAILDYFRYVDREVGRIVRSLDRGTVLMIMSDHGFGPLRKFIYINNWLQQLGWLELKRSPWARLKAAMFHLGFLPIKIYDVLIRLGLGGLKREVVRGQGQGLLRTLFLSFNEVDWSRTFAYSLGNVGQIYLNVRGREPQGTVAPGAEYEMVRSEIIAALKHLRDPQTGRPVVDRVYRREEIYNGHALDAMPDILFIPNGGYFGFGEYEFGSNQVIEAVSRGISGTHRMNGILLLYGGPVRPGTIIKGASLLDLAPTLLHLMGEPVLTDMDGHVLADVLRPSFVVQTAVRYKAPSHTARVLAGGPGFSSGDQEIVAERLRSLGYVG